MDTLQTPHALLAHVVAELAKMPGHPRHAVERGLAAAPEPISGSVEKCFNFFLGPDFGVNA